MFIVFSKRGKTDHLEANVRGKFKKILREISQEPSKVIYLIIIDWNVIVKTHKDVYDNDPK